MRRKRSRKCRRCGQEFKTLTGKDYHVNKKVCLRRDVQPTPEPAETVAEVPAEVPRTAFRPRVISGGATVFIRDR